MSYYSKIRMQGHATNVSCAWIIPAFNMPVRITVNSFHADLHGKHRIESVQTKTQRLITDVDATLGQLVLDLAHR